MIKLHSTDHEKIVSLPDLSEMNVLFAKSVIRHRVKGTIYTASLTEPSPVYIRHPYGMSLLAGETDNKNFNQALGRYLLNSNKKRQSVEWLQAYPSSWYPQLEEILGASLIKMPSGQSYQVHRSVGSPIVEQYERINFSFDPKAFYQKRKNGSAKGVSIADLDEAVFNQFSGAVAPRSFWNNAAEFLSQSVGYTLFLGGIPIAVAFASFIIGKELEIGVETKPEFRGRGYASLVCSHLIDYCLENDYLPVWSCHAGNTGSVELARRLGFSSFKVFPYYCLRSS